MQLRHIELLQAVLQTGSLTAAAEFLHISQPAASKRLQQAELELGFELFYRERGRLIPTSEALLLQAPTQQLANDLQRLNQLAKNLQPKSQQALRLMCTPTLAQCLLPLAFPSWRALYPDTECTFGTEHTPGLVAALTANHSDLALTLRRVSHPSLQCVALAEGQMQVLSPAGFWPSLPTGSTLSVADLSGQPLIGLDDGEGLGRLIESHLHSLAVPVEIKIRVQTYQLARHMVEAGQGVAIVDPFTAGSQERGNLEARPFMPSLPVTLYSLRRHGHSLTVAQQALLEQLQHQALQILR